MLWISITALFFSSCYALEGATDVERAVPVECENSDLGFLVDVSDTFSTRRYTRAINIIQGLVRAFDVRFGGSRAGLVTFSDEASTRIDFDRYRSHWRFNRGLRKLRQNGGRTRIDRGLDEATVVLYNQRYNWLGYKKYLFVLSDGKQTPIDNKRPNLKERTWLLRHQGVHIIAVAMGNWPSYYYLNQLVQYPEREVITVSDRANIREKVEQIRRIACSKAPAVPLHCEKMADMAFLLDMSSSIGGPRRFRYETDFVKGVLDNFSSKKNQIRAGVIAYGAEAWLKIKLNDYTKLESFKKALKEKVKFKGSQLTRIDRALILANKVFFTAKNGDRPEAPNYLILVTDGRQNSGDWDLDQNVAEWFAKPLWDRNITIFAVGVSRASRRQLKKIAGKHGTAIYRRRLKHLKDSVNLIIPSQCKGCHKEANVAFLVDASTTSQHHFSRIKRLVYHVAEGFKQQRTKLQASVIRFSDEAVVDIRFGQFSELYSLQAELDTRMPIIGGRTFINKGLRAAEREFDKITEKGVPKILVVITDGRQTGGRIQPIKVAADSLRQKGVHIVVLQVSNCRETVCKDTLEAIAKKRRRIINFSWSDDIIDTAEKVARSACP